MAARTRASQPHPLTKLVMLVLAIVLINEAVQYGLAWSRIFLATRDSRTALAGVVATAPGDRSVGAQAAQAACTRRNVTLTAYGQQLTRVAVGQRVDARLEMETKTGWALVGATVKALIADGSLANWRAHQPTVRFTYTEQFVVAQ